MTDRKQKLSRAAIVTIVVGAAGGFSSALAQTQTPPISRAEAMEVARICRSDLKAFCAGLKPGNGALAMCLMENRDKLSADCRARVETMAARQ